MFEKLTVAVEIQVWTKAYAKFALNTTTYYLPMAKIAPPSTITIPVKVIQDNPKLNNVAQKFHAG